MHCFKTQVYAKLKEVVYNNVPSLILAGTGQKAVSLAHFTEKRDRSVLFSRCYCPSNSCFNGATTSSASR